jgi:hypothetical protein
MVNVKRKWKSKAKSKVKSKGKATRRRKLARVFKKNHPCAYGHVFSTECGHCINMQEDWDKLTKEVQKEHKDIELLDISENHQANVDSLNKTFQTDLKFSGFPTIFKIMKKNAPVHYYQGDRSTQDMKKWLFS